MNPRTASRLVWGWAALTLSLLAGGIALSGIAGSGESAVLVLPAVAFASVGGLVASRHPGNVIGWLFCLGALGAALQKFAEGYAEYGLARAALAGTEVAAWVASWIWLPWAFLVPTLMFVTFPHGRTDGGLRRLFARFSVALMVVTVLASAVTPGPLEGYPTVTNPFGIGGAVKSVTYVVGLGGMLLSLVALVLSAATLVRRYRRSMGVERQQIKWLGFAAIVLGLTIAIGFSLYLLDLPLAEIGPPGGMSPSTPPAPLWIKIRGNIFSRSPFPARTRQWPTCTWGTAIPARAAERTGCGRRRDA